MEDHIWDVHRATKLTALTIDILNKKISPANFHIQPLLCYLSNLQQTIKKDLLIYGFPDDFIVNAKFDIEAVYEKRTLFIVATLVDVNDKTYTSKTYQEKMFPNSP